jgi:hypothetical protein
VIVLVCLEAPFSQLPASFMDGNDRVPGNDIGDGELKLSSCSAVFLDGVMWGLKNGDSKTLEAS